MYKMFIYDFPFNWKERKFMFKQKFYSLKNILSKDAQYNIIFGERSNGKTYSVLKYGLEKFCQTC